MYVKLLKLLSRSFTNSPFYSYTGRNEAWFDLLLIQTFLLYYVNHVFLTLQCVTKCFFSHDFHDKRKEVCIKTRSTSASRSLKGYVTKPTTLKWSIVVYRIVKIISKFEQLWLRSHLGGSENIEQSFRLLPWIRNCLTSFAFRKFSGQDSLHPFFIELCIVLWLNAKLFEQITIHIIERFCTTWEW